VGAGVGVGVGEDLEIAPPQLVANIAARRPRLSSILRRNLRCARPPARNRPKNSIHAATGQRVGPCGFGTASMAVLAAALMVNVAVACPFTVTVVGLRLHVSWLDDGAQVSAPCR